MSEPNFRAGHVAIVGRPNVGKSTLVNALVGRKVTIVTAKPQTTRHRILGLVNRPEAQLVLVDTPGLHESTRRVMNQYMNRVAISSSQDADVVLFVIEAMRFTEEDEWVWERVRGLKQPLFLVVNKVDRVFPKDQMLPFLEEMSTRVPASGIIPVSALQSDNLNRLVDLVGSRLPVSPPLFAPAHLNNALWHFAFNRLAAVNDQLVAGREDVYFGWQFAAKAARPLPGYAVRYYIGTLAASPAALHASFAIYRALDATIAQNQQRMTRRLSLPVLGIGGAKSLGDQVADTMKLAADDVQTLVIPGCGHHPAEEAPEETLAALTVFLASYRDEQPTANHPGPRAAPI